MTQIPVKLFDCPSFEQKVTSLQTSYSTDLQNLLRITTGLKHVLCYMTYLTLRYSPKWPNLFTRNYPEIQLYLKEHTKIRGSNTIY